MTIADQAREYDATVFSCYVDGLHDAGWLGDVRWARFGYTVTAALVFGVAVAMGVRWRWRGPEE